MTWKENFIESLKFFSFALWVILMFIGVGHASSDAPFIFLQPVKLKKNEPFLGIQSVLDFYHFLVETPRDGIPRGAREVSLRNLEFRVWNWNTGDVKPFLELPPSLNLNRAEWLSGAIGPGHKRYLFMRDGTTVHILEGARDGQFSRDIRLPVKIEEIYTTALDKSGEIYALASMMPSPGTGTRNNRQKVESKLYVFKFRKDGEVITKKFIPFPVPMEVNSHDYHIRLRNSSVYVQTGTVVWRWDPEKDTLDKIHLEIPPDTAPETFVVFQVGSDGSYLVQ